MAPTPGSWQASWEEVGAVVVAASAYAVAARKSGVPGPRFVAFAAATILVLAVVVSPLATLAFHYFLWAHLLQNVALAEWAPALAVLGLSAGMAAALARSRLLSILTQPLVALPLWLASYGVFTGFLLWWPVFQAAPHRLRAGAKAAYLFAAFVLASPLGLVLALLPNPIYGFYESAPRLWGIGPLTDQQIAGVVMAVSEAIVFFAVFAFFFVRFMAEEEAGYSPGDA